MSDLWTISENSFDPGVQHHSETIFTIGNGYLGSRGVMEEAYPDEERSTFVHGVFDDVPIVFTELANVPDWMELEILLAGERFNLSSGTILSFHRNLDLRTATLHRELRWMSPHGHTTHLKFTRFASLAEPHLAGIQVVITPEDYDGKVEVRAGIDAAADNLGIKHWKAISQKISGHQAWLHCRTLATTIDLAMGIKLEIKNANHAAYRHWDTRGHPTITVSCQASQGKAVVAEKWAVIYTSREVRNPVRAVQRYLHSLELLDWSAKWLSHCQYWEKEWNLCDIEIDGDPDAQLALRFNLFQLLAAAPRQDETVSLGAKTLSGYGYRGHSFWDTETFMLPFFTYTRPDIAHNLLSYRWHNLPGARAKALENGFGGAQYPWESAATGEEVTPTWVPNHEDRKALIRIWTGDIEIHISADISYAVWQYWRASGDDNFMIDRGAEIILDTARFWARRVEWDQTNGSCHINNVIGPDEYHDRIDDNAYTNLLVKWHLQTALELVSWLQDRAPSTWHRYQKSLQIDKAELKRWQDVIDRIFIPLDVNTGLIEQFSGYFQKEDVDLSKYDSRTESMQALLGIDGVSQTQVLKQPDVLMLLYLLPDLFDQRVFKANYEYYTPRTDHTYGSSLGPSIQAIMACKMNDPTAAYEHFMRAARADLYDVRGNASDGIHGASAGGLWQSIVFGFAGLHQTQNGWETNPCLPPNWKRISFKIVSMGQPLCFEANNHHD